MSVERDDLEAKLREIESVVDDSKAALFSSGTAVAIAVVVVIILAYLFGRRSVTKGARVEVVRLR